MNVEFRNQILKLINLIFIPLIKGRKYAINTVGNVKYQTFNIFLFFIYAYFLEMELCTFAQKVGRYQKKLPTFLCTEKGTYLLGGWGKILKVPFNLLIFLSQKIKFAHQLRTFLLAFPFVLSLKCS